MRRLFFLVIGLLFCILSNSQTIKQFNWDADIDFLANELPQKHYNFFTFKDKNKFLAGLNAIKSSSKELSDFEIAIRLQQLVAGFGDSHTRVNYDQFIEKNKILPLHLYWFSDGLFVLNTTQENIEILGHQILSVNGVPVQTISDSLSTLVTQDNRAMIKSSIPMLLPLVQVLEFFGIVTGQKIQLALKDSKGIEKTYIIKPAAMNRRNRKMFSPDSLALCFINKRAFFCDYYQKQDSIYYIQYNRCWSKELELKYGSANDARDMPLFAEFEEKVFQTINSRSISKIVFDIRFNSGGNSSQGSQFVAKLAKHLETCPKVKVYVILGRTTFSSAILNAMDFKRITNAVFVGEETSGKPNHFGEVKEFRLPNSGVKVDYSTKFFKRTDKNVSTIAPDINLEQSFTDYKNGIDPAYEWIKKQ